MSRRTQFAICLFVMAAMSMVAFVLLTGKSVQSYAASGAVPNDNGWFALIASILGTGGFSVAGIVTLLLHKILPSATAISDGNVSEVVELSAAFVALMRDRTNRAAQRRFFFALADAADVLPGVVVSHENNVLILKYSGFADPVSDKT